MQFSHSSYSKREIVAAGKLLGQRLEAATEEVREAFRIAHDWRAAHAYPMHCIRHELSGKVRRDGGKGLTAARVKRMASVRRKLAASPVSLYQMQDLAGIRAIMPDPAAVDRVAGLFAPGETSHLLQRENNYITAPRDSGYRSRHLILKFQEGGGSGPYDRQTVEVQLRTRFQHAWATAVEAVGLIRDEHIKGGEGSTGWRRFFALMAGEIAAREGTAPVPGVSEDTLIRRAELSDLDDALGAIRELDGLNEGLAATEKIVGANAYFLLRFDRASRTVTVKPYTSLLTGGWAYDAADGFGASGTDVLIEVDRIADLRAAYPNYFLDVRHFLTVARAAIGGWDLPPEAGAEAAAEPFQDPEFAWLRDYQRRRLIR